MKRKILIMINHLNIGGVEKTLLSLLSAIDNNLYDIDLLLLNDTGCLIEYLPDYVNIIKLVLPIDISEKMQYGRKTSIVRSFRRLDIKNALITFFFVIKNAFNKQILKSIKEYKSYEHRLSRLNKTKYDLAIDYMGYMSFCTYYIADKVDANVKATWIHSEFKKSKTNPRYFKEYYDKFNYFFGVSTTIVEEFINFLPEYKDRTSLFYNIISSKLIKEMAFKGQTFSDSFQGIRLLTVGRLSTEKGYEIAIKVLSKLIVNNYNVKWYVLGEGNDFIRLKKIVKKYNVENSFIFLGSDPNPFKFMQDTNIYVQTSIYEGYSTTTNEARILCKPIITTNVSGAHEQFINGYNGLIVQYDEIEIYNSIVKLIDNKQLCEEFSCNLSLLEIDTTNEIEKLYRIII